MMVLEAATCAAYTIGNKDIKKIEAENLKEISFKWLNENYTSKPDGFKKVN